MNINQIIDDVTERIARGETVRVKLAFKDEVTERYNNKYPDRQLEVVSQDDNYTYFKRGDNNGM